MKKAFINATIYPVEGNMIVKGTLLIDKEKIIAIGTDIDTNGADLIDCEGLSITPGFVDPHTHTGIWGEGAGPYPGDNDGNEVNEAITPYVRTLDAIHPEDIGFADARLGGVTTMGIMHGSANPIGGQLCVVKSYGTEVDDMLIRELAGVKMALGENPKRVGDMRKRAPNTRMGVAHLIRKAFYEAIEYDQEMEQYTKLVKREEQKEIEDRKPIKKPSRDLGKDILVKVLNNEIPVRCHAHRADDIRTAIRLADEFGYDLIIDHTTEGIKVADTIVKKEIPVAIGPLFGGRAKRELINQSMATPGVIHNKGGNVSLMTDSPFNPIHGLRDNLIWAIREGLPEKDGLRTITLNPAKLLGVDERLGSLVVGKDADLLIFNGDPLDGRNYILKTYIDGKLVYERKK